MLNSLDLHQQSLVANDFSETLNLSTSLKQILRFTIMTKNKVCQADQLGLSAADEDQQFISKKDFGTHFVTAPMGLH